jgi:restriction endonuclease S subunit
LQLSDPSNVVRYVELSDVSNQYGEIVNSETLSVFDLPSRATYEIATGDLMTAVAGNSIGTANHVSAFVNEEFDGCVCSNGFRVLKVDQDLIDPLYLLFFFSTKEFQDQIFRLRTGAAIPAISDSDFLSILVPRLSASAENDISQLIQSGYNARRDFRTDLAEQRNAYQQLLN